MSSSMLYNPRLSDKSQWVEQKSSTKAPAKKKSRSIDMVSVESDMKERYMNERKQNLNIL